MPTHIMKKSNMRKFLEITFGILGIAIMLVLIIAIFLS